MAVYFASDFHLGLDGSLKSSEREHHILKWLNSISEDLDALYLLGDIFDYWFEYKHVVPKGYVRLLAALAAITDQGKPVHIFTGNHDLWMFDYLEKEIGVRIHREATHINIDNQSLLIGHGDGLGPGDNAYKLIKKVFSNSVNQWLFARIHPNLGVGLMRWLSKKSRQKELEIIPFLGYENEWLIQYAESQLKSKHFDYFIFGHRHLPLDVLLSNQKSRYINTGDWINHYSYARFENGVLSLEYFKPDNVR